MAQSPIRLGIDAKRAYFNRSGLGNYSRNLVNALVRYQSERLSIYMFTPRLQGRLQLDEEAALQLVHPRLGLLRPLQSVWRSRMSAGAIDRLGIDVYHGLSHELPFGIHRTRAKTVLTVHDLIFMRHPEYFNRIDAFMYQRKVRYACRVAHRIVAISQQTHADLVELLGIDPQRIDVIPQGCHPRFHRTLPPDALAHVAQRHGLPSRYLLCVGTVEQRKNVLAVLRALHEHRIDVPLVVVGRRTDYYTRELQPYIEQHAMRNIIFPNSVADDELPAIYQGALGFIYPSLYEGFGIPIVEALSSGLPVITSQGGCLQEVGGDACLYVNPTDISSIGDAIARLLGDVELRQQLLERGRERIKLFDPQRIAQQYADIYESLMAKP